MVLWHRIGRSLCTRISRPRTPTVRRRGGVDHELSRQQDSTVNRHRKSSVASSDPIFDWTCLSVNCGSSNIYFAHMMMMMTIFESGFMVPTREKLSCNESSQKKSSKEKKGKNKVRQETQDSAQSPQRPIPSRILAKTY